MEADVLLRHIGDILVIITFVTSLAFVIVYHLSARWWENDFGKSLMTYQVTMTIVLGLSISRIVLGGSEHPLFGWLRFGVFAVVPLALTWRIAVLIRLQWRKRNGHGS